ncbi:MAG: hypothetical protein KJZ47_04820, partial [Gemmatimonadales bacterium]|nr:hypothetical protein [Gemmatimonadales bacterium]
SLGAVTGNQAVQMVRAGLLLNLVAIIVVTLVGLFLVPRILLPGLP